MLSLLIIICANGAFYPYFIFFAMISASVNVVFAILESIISPPETFGKLWMVLSNICWNNGTFTFSFGSYTSVNIPIDISANDLKIELGKIPSVGSTDNIIVTRNAVPGTGNTYAWSITYINQLTNTNIPPLILNGYQNCFNFCF